MRRLLIALVILGAAFYAAGALYLWPSGPDPHSKDAVAASASIKGAHGPQKKAEPPVVTRHRAEGSGKDEIRRHCLGLPIACRQVARRALFSRSSLAILGRWHGGKGNLAPEERLGPNQAARKSTAWMDTRKKPCLEGPRGKRSVDPKDAPPVCGGAWDCVPATRPNSSGRQVAPRIFFSRIDALLGILTCSFFHLIGLFQHAGRHIAQSVHHDDAE